MEVKSCSYPRYHPMVITRNRNRPIPTNKYQHKSNQAKLTKQRPPPSWKSDSAVHIIQPYLNKPLPPLPPEAHVPPTLKPRAQQHTITDLHPALRRAVHFNPKPTPRPKGNLIIQRSDTIKLKNLGDRKKLTTDLPLRQTSRKFFSEPPSPLGLFGVFDRPGVKNGKEIRERIWILALTYEEPLVIHGYRGGGKLAHGLPAGFDERKEVRALSRVSRAVRAEASVMFYRCNRFVIWHDGDERLEGCRAGDVLETWRGMIGEAAFSRITILGFAARVAVDTAIASSSRIEKAGKRLGAKTLDAFKAVIFAAKMGCYPEQEIYFEVEIVVTVGRKQLSVKESFDLRKGVAEWRADTVSRWEGEMEREKAQGERDAAAVYGIMAVGMREVRKGLRGVLPVQSLI